jgi:hypothetical protein
LPASTRPSRRSLSHRTSNRSTLPLKAAKENVRRRGTYAHKGSPSSELHGACECSWSLYRWPVAAKSCGRDENNQLISNQSRGCRKSRYSFSSGESASGCQS